MAEKETERKTEGAEQVVTPWEAKAGEGQTGIDYDKLISMYFNSLQNGGPLPPSTH